MTKCPLALTFLLQTCRNGFGSLGRDPGWVRVQSGRLRPLVRAGAYAAAVLAAP